MCIRAPIVDYVHVSKEGRARKEIYTRVKKEREDQALSWDGTTSALSDKGSAIS